MPRFAALFVAVAMMSFAANVRAQGNYRSAALGGRSALMGDTGVALGTDGAAPFLNPATVTRVESTLALSVTFLSFDTFHASNWYVPGAVDATKFGAVPISGADISRVSGNAIPSTFCLFNDLPRLNNIKDPESRKGLEKIATCIGNAELQSFDWVGQGYQAMGARSVAQASNAHWSWQRFVVAPTYAVNITETLSFGASIQGVFSNYQSSWGAGTITSGGALPETSSSYLAGASANDFGLNALVGGAFSYEHFSVGASIQSPDLTVYGHGNISTYSQLASTAGLSAATYLGQGGFHAHEPAKFSLGVGWDWPRGTIEVDAMFALADPHALELDTVGSLIQTPTTTSTTALNLTTRFQPTFNINVGAEYYVRKSLSLLAGVATDFSAVDNVTATSLAQSSVNRILGSFGAGIHTDNGTLLLGAQAYYGWGQALAPNLYVDPPTQSPTDVRTFGMLFVLAGATNVKAIAQAVDEMKRLVVKPKPSSTP